MPRNEKYCMTLVFTKKIKKSHRNKVKEFWKFLDTVNDLKPYVVASNGESPDTKDTDEAFPQMAKEIWSDQLQVFRKYGLDKAALAASETCKVCHAAAKNRSSEYADTVKESYEQLLNDIKVYEERLSNIPKMINQADQKKSSIS